MKKYVFNRADRKTLQDRIDGLQRQIDQCQIKLETIPKQHGYANVKDATAEYKADMKELEMICKTKAELDEVSVLEIKVDTKK